jgi:3-hydroxyisobutyrate dehydrogenase
VTTGFLGLGVMGQPMALNPAAAGADAQLASPLLDVCHALYGETVALGHDQEDMVAVLRAVEARSQSLTG